MWFLRNSFYLFVGLLFLVFAPLAYLCERGIALLEYIEDWINDHDHFDGGYA